MLGVFLDSARSDEAVQLHEGPFADMVETENAVKLEQFVELYSSGHSLVASVIETVVAAQIVEIVAEGILASHVAE